MQLVVPLAKRRNSYWDDRRSKSLRWKGRRSITLMIVLALVCAHSTHAQIEDATPKPATGVGDTTGEEKAYKKGGEEEGDTKKTDDKEGDKKKGDEKDADTKDEDEGGIEEGTIKAVDYGVKKKGDKKDADDGDKTTREEKDSDGIDAKDEAEDDGDAANEENTKEKKEDDKQGDEEDAVGDEAEVDDTASGENADKKKGDDKKGDEEYAGNKAEVDGDAASAESAEKKKDDKKGDEKDAVGDEGEDNGDAANEENAEEKKGDDKQGDDEDAAGDEADVDENKEEDADADPSNESTPKITDEPSEPDPTKEPMPKTTEVPTHESAPDSTKEPTSELTEEPVQKPVPDPTKEPMLKATEEPTREPVSKSAKEPTPELTEEPVHKPVPGPTKEPMLKATEEPTRESVPKSKKAPTLELTDEPTHKPVPDPTKKRTPKTTEVPTREPAPDSTEPTPELTDESTRKSVPGPESTPSKRPTPREDRDPTKGPTSMPMSQLTPLPASSITPHSIPKPFSDSTPAPVPSTTSVLTPFLAVKPTSNPMLAPASSPTFLSSPTIDSTVKPTSSLPTLKPPKESSTTLAPVIAPTVSPFGASTDEAKSEPIVSELPVQNLEENVQMTIGGIMLPLIAVEQNVIESLTSHIISDSIIFVLGADQIINLEVTVTTISSSSRMLRSLGDGMKGSRNLAETKFTLHVVILIQSAVETHDVNRYIYGAFDDDSEKALFIDLLKETGHAAFANVYSVSVAPLTDEGPKPVRVEDPTTESFSIGDIVVPIVVAVLAGIGLATFFLYRRRKLACVESRECIMSPSPHEPVEFAGQAHISSEIEVCTGSELSSLGDPIPISASGVVVEGSVASMSGTPDHLSLDYDFQKALGNDFASSLGGTEDSIPTSLLTKDDNTLSVGYVFKDVLDIFDVEAAPGPLGLALETSDEGIPAVYMIKPSSQLAGRVEVGDWLLSVDEKDVALMLASDASRYITTKQANPVRRLRFARPLVENFDSPTEPTGRTECNA